MKQECFPARRPRLLGGLKTETVVSLQLCSLLRCSCLLKKNFRFTVVLLIDYVFRYVWIVQEAVQVQPQ